MAQCTCIDIYIILYIEQLGNSCGKTAAKSLPLHIYYYIFHSAATARIIIVYAFGVGMDYG